MRMNRIFYLLLVLALCLFPGCRRKSAYSEYEDYIAQESVDTSLEFPKKYNEAKILKTLPKAYRLSGTSDKVDAVYEYDRTNFSLFIDGRRFPAYPYTAQFFTDEGFLYVDVRQYGYDWFGRQEFSAGAIAFLKLPHESKDVLECNEAGETKIKDMPYDIYEMTDRNGITVKYYMNRKTESCEFVEVSDYGDMESLSGAQGMRFKITSIEKISDFKWQLNCIDDPLTLDIFTKALTSLFKAVDTELVESTNSALDYDSGSEFPPEMTVFDYFEYQSTGKRVYKNMFNNERYMSSEYRIPYDAATHRTGLGDGDLVDENGNINNSAIVMYILSHSGG